MHNRQLPDDILLHVFSSFNKASLVSPLGRVCKHWHTMANKDQLWLQLIRPEYQAACKNSGMSPKEFYKNNIDARIDTYYLVGATVKTGDENWLGFTYFTTLNENDLLKAFPQSESIKIFYSREEAIKYADKISKVESLQQDPFNGFIYNYHPIFTVQVNEGDLTRSQPDKIDYESYLDEKDTHNDYQCFEISSDRVNNYTRYFIKQVLLTLVLIQCEKSIICCH